MDQVFDLFDNLGATDEQLDFPIVYTSAMNGIAGLSPDELAEDMHHCLKPSLMLLSHHRWIRTVHSVCRFQALIMITSKV